MQKFITLFILLISFSSLKAQTDEQIINEIRWDLFDPCQEWPPDTIYINEIKANTFFYDREDHSYESIGGFAIPSHIISEWKKNMEDQNLQPKWNEKHLNIKDTMIVGKDTIIVKKTFLKCLSKSEIDTEPYNTKQDRIYAIGKIVFDNSRETAIFSFAFSRLSDSDVAGGYTVLIKKVFGKWVIITKFDHWIS